MQLIVFIAVTTVVDNIVIVTLTELYIIVSAFNALLLYVVVRVLPSRKVFDNETSEANWTTDRPIVR